MAWVVFFPHCLALTQNCKKISQSVTEMWFWSGDPKFLTDLVVLNFCTFHLKEKWTTMLLVEHWLAVWQARVQISARHPREVPQLSQQRWRKWNWASAYIRELLYEWLLYKKNVCIPTQKCVLYREPEYLFPNQKRLRRRKSSSVRRLKNQKTRRMIWKVMPRGGRSFHTIIQDCDENWKKVFEYMFCFILSFHLSDKQQ